MRTAIRKIDRALKEIYLLPSSIRAENYLITRPVREDFPNLPGALFLHQSSPENLEIAIYLSASVRRRLVSFPQWSPTSWEASQERAFHVASEEVSHFHYLLFHAGRGRSVSQLELEIQGEVDKFLLRYWLTLPHVQDCNLFLGDLFEKQFIRFSLQQSLDEIQSRRYLEANHFAKEQIKQLLPFLAQREQGQRVFSELRKTYRLGTAERVADLHSSRRQIK